MQNKFHKSQFNQILLTALYTRGYTCYDVYSYPLSILARLSEFTVPNFKAHNDKYIHQHLFIYILFTDVAQMIMCFTHGYYKHDMDAIMPIYDNIENIKSNQTNTHRLLLLLLLFNNPLQQPFVFLGPIQTLF